GSKVAVITGDSLVIQGIGMDTDRVIVDHGVSMPIAWSPDSRHLAVSAVPKIAGVFETQLVDIEDRVPRALPVIGRVAFLSTTELGVVPSYRHRSVAIYRIGEYAAAAAICEVPGDYTFLWDIAALADGTIVVETVTLKTGRHALVMLRRDCGIRARFSGEPIAGIATTDTGTVIAIRDSLDEILEISPDGPIVSRRRVSGALGTLLGRRRGADYVTTLALKTDLVRVRGGVARQVFSIPGNAAFELSPDGNSLVWIERDGRGMAPGPLWLATPNDLTHSHAVFHNALTVGWSPDGARLAVLVSDAAPAEPGRPQPARRSAISLIVVDRNGGVPRRVPVADLDPDAAPVWLDANRIATRSDDRTTYGWYDLDTGAQGELVDRRHGSTLWLARSPRDGTLAMWRIGGPGAADAGTGGLWLQPPGGDPAPLWVQDIGHFLIPSWSRSGELVVRAFETGAVSRVALDTGALAPIAQLAAMPLGRLFDDHVMTLPDGDLLAVNHELGANVAVVRDDEPAARRWQIAGSP
ncbi:MAG TPA: hypothetical protein VK601_00840, partial [Kofleriaceae bacterium]|nr:hypothetical protein [Kofleriaceae bacterium]